jgi:tetratricopeptide (TPR) repeat protein
MISITLSLSVFLVYSNEAHAGKDKMFTYNDPHYGTKVQYPSDWKFSIDEGEPTFSPPESDPSKAYIASVWFSKRNLNQSTGIGYYLNYSRDYYNSFPDIEVVKALSNITLDENPSYLLEWNTTSGYRTLKVGTIIGTEEYYITYHAIAKKYHQYLPIVQKMLSSFQIVLPERNIPYITITPTVWSDDNLEVYVVVETHSKTVSSKYVQDAVSAINKWSESLKKYSNNNNAWNFNVHVKTETLSEEERYQFRKHFNPRANIILELKASNGDEDCSKIAGASLHPNDINRLSVYSYVYTSCMGVELPHENVYSTVLHEFGHNLGLGHAYYKDGDLMCSDEKDKHEHPIITCSSKESHKDPTVLDIEGILYRYGTDGFDTPNRKLKGEQPRFYQETSISVAIDNKTKIDRLLTQGWTLLDFGRTNEALAYCDKALGIDSNNTDALYAKGYVLDILGRYNEAITYYGKILSIDPTDSYALYGIGYALNTQGRYNEAIEYYNRALAIVPNDIDTLSEKGYALDNLGKYEEAISYYDKVLSIDPTDSNALHRKNDILKKMEID